jgi:two-component sensor histidine kinase
MRVGMRDPRVPRIPTTAVLACWALGALVFAFLPQGAESKSVIATVFSLSTAAFTAAARAEGHERAFLRLMGLGMVFEVHGISLTLRAALDTERRGDREEALEMFGRALAASRAAEFRISRPYDELSALRGESPPGAADFLRQRLRKFEKYFGVKTHDDTQAPLDVLNPAETAALIRVFVEAFWNVAKHSGASNLYLESRRVGSVLIIRVRDGGHGFDTGKPPPGLGLEYMRRRTGEVGAELDVISTPGRGTSVRVRFRKHQNTANP